MCAVVGAHWPITLYMADGERHRQRGTSQCLGASPTTMELGDVHKGERQPLWM
jgi:hypothetical protein